MNKLYNISITFTPSDCCSSVTIVPSISGYSEETDCLLDHQQTVASARVTPSF